VFPKHGVGAAALIARADDAMYRAKENKSRVAPQEEAALHACAVAYRRPIGRDTIVSECSTNF
jgi:GGDEF domain-containing protein